MSYHVSFFEMYAGQLFDLFAKRKLLNLLEDANHVMNIQGLTQKVVKSPEEMERVISEGEAARTTHATAANDTSSRSHAICQIIIKKKSSDQVGKLLLVDLAGSEYAQKSQGNDRSRRLEMADINTSLLCLKECIRALYMHHNHIPFRGSKLTKVLRDSFIDASSQIRIIMIACVSPGSISSLQSLNTLRYAGRLKEIGVAIKAPPPIQIIEEEKKKVSEEELGKKIEEMDVAIVQNSAQLEVEEQEKELA